MPDPVLPAVPRHVAIIMDGNGRWAQTRGFGRTWGHREGAKRVDEITTECTKLGIEYLTLYAFSTENWNRPSFEVNMLMRLLVQHLRTMDKKLLKNRVMLTAQGGLERLPKFVQVELKRVMRVTERPDPSMVLNLALSYGGRQEIVDSARALAAKVQRGEMGVEQIDEQAFAAHLYRPAYPDPDLLIRTGGEYRVSNFLLWQIAYAELVVTNTLWPDFGPASLREALAAFATRKRRFGKTGEQVASRHEGLEAPSPS
jgi:undecaprenyl diphosphate synthase